MNKMVKGSVAGATGIVLLMGGFGTYALWSDSADLDGGAISSGTLTVTAGETPVWQEISGDVGADPQAWAPATDKMVPGDEVRLTQPLDVEAAGKNLKAKLTVGGISEDFANMLVTVSYGGKTASSAADGSGPMVLNYGTADMAALNSADDAVVTFSFPSSVTGVVDQSKSVDLADVTLAVEQVRP